MICKVCGEDLPESEYHNSIGWASGKVSACKSCEKKRKQASYQRRKEKVLAKAKEYYWANRENTRANSLKRTYGLLWEDYLELYNSQKGLCVICDQPLELFGSDRHATAQVDHCHSTGKIRGLLCTKCNTGLGNFRDSPELLQKAIEYINGA